MNAEPTPWPWAVHASHRVIVKADGAFNEIAVKDGKVLGDDLPHSICLLRDPGEGFSEDETLANGFLIAAAPEVLAALEGMLSIAEAWALIDGGKNIDLDASDAVKDARAAIAKARGQ